MYYIGIDWSTKHEDICIIDEHGQIIKEFRISVTRNGFEKLLNELKNLSENPNDFKISIETEQNILVDFLLFNEYEVFALNPLSVNRFKEIYNISGKKDDRFDALMMAKMLLSQHSELRPIVRSSTEVSELAIHCATMNDLISQRTRVINQLKSHLHRFYPVFLSFFKNFKSSVTLKALMKMPNPSELISLTKIDLMAKLEDIPYFHSKRKEKFCELLISENIGFDNRINHSYSARVQILVQQISLLNDQISDLQKEITNLFENHSYSEIFKSLPGAGDRIAPEMLAHLGDNPNRFTSRDQFRCYAGTAPVTEQSGLSLRRVKIRRACNKSLRNTLHIYAFCTIKYVPWARKYYDTQRLKKGHNAAIRSLANKWGKIIFSMWKNKTKFNSNIFQPDLKH